MDTALIDSPLTTIITVCIGVIVILLMGSHLYASLRIKYKKQKSLVDRINNLLPQTQCGQCGYEGCRPYARAIHAGTAINQCPPGGNETIIRLANLLNLSPLPLNSAHGEIKALEVAVIREAECIGCTKCIVACPVDAILGGPKVMHTVIETECTGCDLCVEPCPVDCIDMVTVETLAPAYWNVPNVIPNPLYGLEHAHD